MNRFNPFWIALFAFLFLVAETALLGAFWIVEPSFAPPWAFYKVFAAIFVLIQWPLYYLFYLWIFGQESGQIFPLSLAWKVRWQSFITFMLSVFLLGLVQYWATKIPWEWSVSQNSQNRLSAQTETAISRFESIKLIYFADQVNRQEFLPWALFLERKFSSIIHLEVVDPTTSPMLLERYLVKKVPALVMLTNRGSQILYDMSEIAFTQGLTKILRPERPTVCFTASHGEYSLFDQSPQGLSFFKEQLQNERWGVREWKFDGECDFLVVMGPQRDLSTQEAANLRSLLLNAKLKGMLVALELPYRTKLTKWENVLGSAPIGLTFSQGIILDQTSPQQGLEASVVTGLEVSHEGRKNDQRISEQAGKMVFPMARSFGWDEKSKDNTWMALMVAKSFPHAWVETDIETLFSTGKATFQKGSDEEVTAPLIAVSDHLAPRKRWIALASARTVLNGYQSQVSHFQTLLNLMSWGLFLDQEMAVERPKLHNHSLSFIASQLQLLFYLSVMVIPFFMLSTAFWLWRRERRPPQSHSEGKVLS